MEAAEHAADMELDNFDGLDEDIHHEEAEGDDSRVVMIDDDVHEMLMNQQHDNGKVVEDDLICEMEKEHSR